MYWKFPKLLITSDTLSKSDWLFNTQSRVLMVDTGKYREGNFGH